MKVYWILILIVFMFGCSTVVDKGSPVGSGGGEGDILQMTKDKIDDANHCINSGDCFDVGGVCPFGCEIFVNAEEIESIREAIKYYNSNVNEHCAFDCAAPCESVTCIEGKCVPSC